MASDELLPDQPSRRAFLRTSGVGLVGASGLLLAGCGGGSSAKSKLIAGSYPDAVRESDISILNGVLDLEYTAIAAYTAGIPLLSGHARGAAAQFLGHELSHASKLVSTIKGAGGKPHPQAANYPLTNPKDAAGVLDILNTTESSLVDAYLAAIPRLMPGWLRSVAAGILANEGQHISVLRALQGRRPVPAAFVTASE
jgi:bacterioferritin (cytochrome b1)